MAKKLDRILVIDVESTCWEGGPPPGQMPEIIEVGLCLLDVPSGERLEKRSLLVRPERSTVSDYCTALTTLTPEAVAGGVSLREACRCLELDYASKERLWASYGDYDRLMFERDCQARGADYPFGTGHINVKSLFAVIRNLKREVGLESAMRMAGWAIEGIPHRGADDAWNIARLLGSLLLRARRQP